MSKGEGERASEQTGSASCRTGELKGVKVPLSAPSGQPLPARPTERPTDRLRVEAKESGKRVTASDSRDGRRADGGTDKPATILGQRADDMRPRDRAKQLLHFGARRCLELFEGAIKLQPFQDTCIPITSPRCMYCKWRGRGGN